MVTVYSQIFQCLGPGGLIVLGLFACLTCVAQRVIQNLYFHPLAHFPGPRIAAITTLYKGYIDCVAKSSFVHNLERLHAIYGEDLAHQTTH
jgi:hypothetical protein